MLPLSVLAAEIAATSDVLARRGGQEITESETDARVHEIPLQQRANFVDNAERIETMLSQMLLVEQMAAEARKLGLETSEKYREARKLAEQRQLALAYQEYLFENAPPFNAKALAEEAYAAAPEDFVVGDAVDVRHILIKTDCRSPEAARALAESLRVRVLKGESMEELARKYSEDDVTAAEGGLYRDLRRGKLVKPFEDAAFAMDTPGELSAVTETPYGYHVIEMVAHRQGRQASFEEIREGLEAQLSQRHQQRYLRDRSDRLLNMETEGNPERLRALRTRYGSAEIVEPASAAQPAAETSKP